MSELEGTLQGSLANEMLGSLLLHSCKLSFLLEYFLKSEWRQERWKEKDITWC